LSSHPPPDANRISLEVLKEKGILTEDDAKSLKKDDGQKLKGKFKDGFKWESGDKTASIQIGGRVHGDVDIFETSHAKPTNIYLRRARLEASGKLYEYYEFKVQGDYGEGAFSAKDLFVNMNYDERLQLKVGQYKEPFALEQITSTKYIDFKERSLIGSRIAPDRDIGIMLHGHFAEKTLGYQLGVFNGNGSNKIEDTDGDKDIAMRVWYEPFKDLHLGGAFTWGHLSRGLTDYKQSGSSTNLLAFDSAKVNGKNMNLLRTGAELSYGIGPARITSEYMRADYENVNVVSTKTHNDFFVQGVYATASWFLTGEEKRPKGGEFGKLHPNQNFNLKTGGLGAWELLAGYEWVDVDSDWLRVARLSGADRTNSYKAGINWYHNPLFRVMLDYVYNDYSNDIVTQDVGAKKDFEHQVWMRFALEF
jgi:phosphate-selective porin OprO/OprP